MSVLSQFGGGVPVTKAIVNRLSDNGWTNALRIDISGVQNKYGLSGAMTANTLKQILSVTGRGCINWLGFWTADATSRTVRAKITIDGVVVLDSTSAAISTVLAGGIYIGEQYNGYVGEFDPTYFNQSLLIEMASSLTETDKLAIAYRYKTF